MNEILKVVDKLQKLVQNIQKTKLRVEKKKIDLFWIALYIVYELLCIT